MSKTIDEGLISTLIRRLEKLATSMEKASVAEYIELYRNPRRIMYLNFVAGVVRGFGIAVGFTVVGAVFLLLLTRLASLNLPVIGDYIAQLTKIVMERLATAP
ncbi:MAG: DUF5665 domain-containing protein [Limnochordia bacterium]|jgi:hypothetical protein|nr:DUF5665 domain-containing protein [Limnochordia bacterium]MDD2629415.1 DUF5665 domain-containing protein [Limnochordia bacterium]MDD4518716.1 DUF5665 domain-containing protein [Limnochordia bacterium]